MATSIELNQAIVNSILEDTNISVWTCSLPTREVTWNKATTQLLELTDFKQQWKLEDFHASIHRDDENRISEVIKASIQSRDIFCTEFRVRNRSGIYQWFLIKGFLKYNNNNEPTTLHGIIMNINSQRTNQDQLNEAKTALIKSDTDVERYSAFISQTAEGIWRLELTQKMPIFLSLKEQIDWIYEYGYLAECNEVFAKMYGFSTAKEIVGVKLSDFLSPKTKANIDYLRAFIKADYRLKGIESEEIDFDGQTFYFSNSLIGVVEDGFLFRAWGIQTDITDRKNAESDLVVARQIAEAANQAKSHFLANMSHEIRTPLSAILGFIDLLQDPDLSDDDKRQFSQIIQRNGKELLKLIDDILDLSKVEAGQLSFDYTTINLREFTKDLISSLTLKAKDKNITLEYEMRDSCPDTITTDRTRLRQILINIIGNAIKFTDYGFVRLVISYSQESSKVHFFVHDTGIGIKEEDQVRLFKPFSQADSSMNRKFGGTGLGLSLSKKLAEELGGDVRLIESIPNHGTLFEIKILDRSRMNKNKDDYGAIRNS